MVHRLICVVVLAVGATAPAATPAAARTVDATHYLALGDSLAVGYQPDPDLSRDHGYVAQLHAGLAAREPGLELTNLACSGATTTTVLDGGGGCRYDGADSQLAAAEDFLSRNAGRVSLVTVDIGANDVNRCTVGGGYDPGCVRRAADTAATNLREIARRLRAAAPGVPVVGMDYYDPHLAAWLDGPAGESLARLSVQLTDQFNQALRAAYADAGVPVADVAGAYAIDDLTTPVELPGYGTVPLAVARVCTWTWMCADERRKDIHPNTDGYTAIADAFRDVLRRRPGAAAPG